MTNYTGQKLALDSGQGRKTIQVLTQGLTERVRSMSASRPFALFVIVCAVVLGTYYFLMAAPIYVSEASFSIRGRETPTSAGSLLAQLGGGGGGEAAGGTDTAELVTYVESYAMAQKLDQQFHLRATYSQPRLDFLNWLPRSASRDSYLSFYRKMVHVSIDHDTSLIQVRTKAFDPQSSQAMAQAVLRISADYLNELSSTVRRDTLRTSEQELQNAEQDVRHERLTMAKYWSKTGTLDPAATALATAAGITGMQQQVVQLKADMAAEGSYAQMKSPQMVELQARINGLEGQIAAQQKVIANKADDSMTDRLRTFEGLKVNSEYAERKLVAALSAYDAARTVASQRERFVVPAVAPNLPDQPTEPHRLTSFLEAMLVLIAVYGIVALAIAGVRDHQGI
jgi:capsular polysaccharide transport system permease protein